MAVEIAGGECCVIEGGVWLDIEYGVGERDTRVGGKRFGFKRGR